MCSSRIFVAQTMASYDPTPWVAEMQMNVDVIVIVASEIDVSAGMPLRVKCSPDMGINAIYNGNFYTLNLLN